VTGILRVPRRAALAAIATLVAAASLVSFAESYRGLYLWAHHHGLAGGWAVIWPLQVDVFIAVGELALFVALADRWPPRSRAAAWAVTLAGLAVSVAGNVGHVTSHSLTSRGTAAVPPLAAASALAVGLGVLKRVVEHHHKATTGATGKPAARTTRKATGRGQDAAAESTRKAITQGHPAPSARALARTHHIGRDKAAGIRAAVLAEADGHGGQPGQLTRT
jgi:hypothetical protein